MKTLHVAYILSTYPGLHTTFVDREVNILRQLGVRLDILAMDRPEGMLSPEQKEIQKTVNYLEVRGATALLAHLYFLLIRPALYLATIFELFTGKHSSFRARGKTLRQFHKGVLAAYMIKDAKIDHIHAHFLHSTLVALTIHRLAGIPYSVTAHAAVDIFVKPVMLEEKLARAKFIATCTKYNMNYLKGLGKGVFDQKVKMIYHGLDVNRYKRKNPVSEIGTPVILGVGQLKERKGFHFLIEACKLLQERGVDFECRIVGEGPMRAKLEESIDAASLHGKVILCGALSQDGVIEEYENATIFALPVVLAGDGDRDGIPNVILEALAMELPVVSTQNSAVPEVIDDGVNGVLVPPGNVEALAGALDFLLKNSQARIEYGLRGRQTVIENFDPEKNARKLLGEMTA